MEEEDHENLDILGFLQITANALILLFQVLNHEEEEDEQEDEQEDELLDILGIIQLFQATLAVINLAMQQNQGVNEIRRAFIDVLFPLPEGPIRLIFGLS